MIKFKFNISIPSGEGEAGEWDLGGIRIHRMLLLISVIFHFLEKSIWSKNAKTSRLDGTGFWLQMG